MLKAPRDDKEVSQARRLGILGFGQAGINVLDLMVMHGTEPIQSIALDTDLMTIEASVAAEKLLLGSRVARGLGCTGDLLRGLQIWRTEANAIERLFRGLSEVIILAGLGGGSGSAFALEAAKMARAAGVRVLVVCTLPFGFETPMRQEIARRILGEIRCVADVVLTFANDRALPWPCSRENIRQSYHVLNQLFAQGVESLVQILQVSGMTPIDFSDVQKLFGCGNRGEITENCWLGVGEVELNQGVEELVKSALESPLLAEKASWQQADACLACLVGGRDLALSDLQQLTKILEARLGGQMPVRLGAKLNETHRGRMRLCLLMAVTQGAVPVLVEVESLLPRLDPMPVVTPSPVAADPLPVQVKSVVAEKITRKLPATILKIEQATKPKAKVESLVEESIVSVPVASAPVVPPVEVVPIGEKATPSIAKRKPSRQEELPFDTNRGRFDKSCETMYRGENLDQPTFRRRKLAIKG